MIIGLLEATEGQVEVFGETSGLAGGSSLSPSYDAGWPDPEAQAAAGPRSAGMIWASAGVVLYSWMQARFFSP
jgi:hypothetical protein